MESNYIFLFLALAAIIWVISSYNTIIKYNNKVSQAWSDVITYQRNKIQTISTLNDTVSNYSTHEKELIQKITELREAVNNIEDKGHKGLDEIVKLQKETMSKLSVSVEAYPDLKASELYKSLMDKLYSLDANVSASLQIYNNNIQLFNTYIKQFPSVFVNNVTLKYKEKEFYENSEAEEDIKKYI